MIERRSTNIEDFGSNGFTYVRGDETRYRTKRVRTVLPTEIETNEAFEQRMHDLALQLLRRPEIHSVGTEIDTVDGAHVKCTITMVEAPVAAPIAPDARRAGKRFTDRGGRGGSNASQVAARRN